MSTRWIGGIGGVERSVAAMVKALDADHVDVCARHVIRSEYLVRPAVGHVWHPVRWLRPSPGRRILSRLWPLLHWVVRPRSEPYDLYVQFFHGRDVRGDFSAHRSVLLPNGNDVRDLEATFDYVGLESPANASYLADASKAILLPPPLEPMAETSTPVPGLPDRYFLTVFNPYSPKKGADLLARVARKSPLPFVWCSSTSTISEAASAIDNVVSLQSASQSQLRFLYENCVAYVSFSQSEGFGFSVADALLYGTPVISRRIGVLTHTALDLRAVHLYSDESELLDVLSAGPDQRVRRDLSDLSPDMFRRRLQQIIAEDGQ